MGRQFPRKAGVAAVFCVQRGFCAKHGQFCLVCLF